ncbi:MAG: hypothetical protein AB2733_19355 [Candidatus Thiodiazotropha taylori]
MTYEQLRSDLHDAYMKYYVEGFKVNDVGMIDKIIKYPIAYIHDGVVSMHDKYPIDPKKLKEDKQWSHSTDWKFEITAVNEHEAHAVASAVRRRKDGSKIENVHGFYAFAMTNDGWKMYAVADITF